MTALTIRLPDSVHRKIKELAANDGVSVNQFIASAAAEKMASGGFRMIGSGEQPEEVRKALGDFNGKVAEIEKRDNCSRFEAMRKARTEHPELFEAYREAADDSANAA